MASLAARLAAGEDSAFAELYDACADQLHRYAWSRLGSAEAARDVVQTVFLRVATSRRRFAGVENPAAYVFAIARNETVRAVRRAGRRRESPVSVEALWEHAHADESMAHRAEEAEIVRAALAKLAEEDREIVELKVYGGLTFAEIGAAVGRPAATAATRYRRALESLRGWLARQMR
jgi:RNA polymerase sigma-70 factor (ECF subfamily)